MLEKYINLCYYTIILAEQRLMFIQCRKMDNSENIGMGTYKSEECGHNRIY